MAAMHCSHCRSSEDELMINDEAKRRSSSALAPEDDDASSEVSTELGSDASRLLEPESLVWPAPCETLIFFDWDDTLFPTTWLRERGLLEEDALISPEQDVQLQALANLVAVTLETAKRRGGVAIVTNAEEGWVELSCRAFMPSLQNHLEGVRIVSARTNHEKHGLFAPTMWKCHAFAEVVAEFFTSGPSDAGAAQQQRRSIVSLGDSEHEMEALKWVTTGTECYAKSLKFVQRPCLEQLMAQHELVADFVDEVVDHDGNLDYEVGEEDSS